MDDYRKVKRQRPPEPEPGIDYDRTIGPERPKTFGQQARESVGSWAKGGISNFLENSRRPMLPEPRERRSEREGKSRRREREREPRNPFADIRGQGLNLNTEMLDMGGIDFSMHPDPMYRGQSGKGRSNREQKAKRVTVTTKTYHY